MENCCSICIKRLNSNLVSISDILTQFLNEYDLISSQDTDNEKYEESYCPLCLGILYPKFVKRLISLVQQKFQDEKYDVDDFNICISYSISCIIRERLAEIYMQNEMSETFPEINLLKLKDVCKILYKAVLEKALNMQSNHQSDLNICINFIHSQDETESAKISKVFPQSLTNKNHISKRKRKRMKYESNGAEQLVTRTDLFNLLPQLNLDHLSENSVDIPPKSVKDKCDVTIVFERQPLCIGGRYIKFSRYVNQSPWVVDGVKRSKASVQELISDHLCNEIRCDEIKFSSSGREDADVRMLGDGRPFVLQFLNPRRAKFTDDELLSTEKRINAASNDVQVLKLCVLSPKEFEILKQGEEEKKKHYSALCFSHEPITEELLKKISANSEMVITQKTPIRVLHRRPLHDRKRTVTNMETLYVDEHHFQLFLVTQAGTYVKEFVHGDFGRTNPSLSNLLGIPLDILELDVEKVDLPWPPDSKVVS